MYHHLSNCLGLYWYLDKGDTLKQSTGMPTWTAQKFFLYN